MTVVRTFDVLGLAKVQLNTRDPRHPTLRIRLDAAYAGDLRDIPKKTPGGSEDAYLVCNEASAINSERLKRFMEVLAQWDFTGDGVPDCSEIIAAIEEALYLSCDAADEFHRPNIGLYTRLVMSIMPPAPRWHVILNFGDLKPRFRVRHHLAAVPMLAIVLGLILVQEYFLPWTHYTVLSGAAVLLKPVGLSSWTTTIVIVAVISFMAGRRRKSTRQSPLGIYTYGLLNKAAVFEEQAFREGSEDWTLWQRIRSCVAFGAIHMTNLIYPLATIVPLALGGGLLMGVYLRTYGNTKFRRTAVLNAAVWHRVYNRMAFIAIGINLAILLGVAFAGGLAGAVLTLWVIEKWKHSKRVQPTVETTAVLSEVAAS